MVVSADDVKAKVKDDSGKLTDPEDFLAALAEAVKRYSRYKPATNVADVTGNSGHDYDLPDEWHGEFSTIESIEYPVGEVPECYLDEEDDFLIYQSPAGRKIRLRYASPGPHETFRVTFTSLRTTATIPEIDTEAVVTLAAALCLEQLANAFAQLTDSTNGADAVNYRSKSADFATRAKRLMALYKEHLGIKEGDTQPAASAVTDVSENYPGGAERLTHARWARNKR